MIADFGQDLRFALRSLRLRPGFNLAVVLTLALGIAANVAIFRLVNAALLRPLPVRAPEELVLFSPGQVSGRQLGPTPTAIDGRAMLFPYAVYKRLRAQTEGLAIAAQDSNLEAAVVRRPGAASDDAGESAAGRCVSANFFDVLGVPAYLGRTFQPDDDGAQDASPVLVLSHRLWERRFGSNPEIIGQALSINGSPYTVIGVAPPGFSGANVGSATDFWVPIGMANRFTRVGIDVEVPEYSWLQLLGRLKPGATLESAQASADVSLKRYLAEIPGQKQGLASQGSAPPGASNLRIELEAGATGLSGARAAFRAPLLALMTGVGLLLLIVCLNVSHLLLSRAMSRQQEISIRSALGATRARLARQLLTEGLVLAALGAALGALAARAFSNGLASLAATGPSYFQFNLDAHADERVVAFNLAIAVGVAVLLGLVPSWHALRHDLQQALRSTAQAVTTSGSRLWLSRALMVSQVAFSLVLLVAAGLLSSSLGKLRDVTTGFDEEHVLMAQVDIQATGVDDERARFLYEDIPRRVAASPGVVAASMSHPPVFGIPVAWGITFPGSDLPPKGFAFYIVSPDYFDALGVRVLRGRGFSHTDSRDAPRVAVVNETMAQNEFGGRDAIGQRIRLDGEHDVEIVGVVSDARTFALSLPLLPLFYLPLAQPHGIPANIVPTTLEVRGSGDPALLIEQVRRAVAQAQTGLLLTDIRPLSEQIARSVVRERLLALLAGAFGLSALFLVAVGLYGVIAQWAAQRTREIGIRMALGATARGVQWLVLRQALGLVLIGLALGIPAAIAVSKLLESLLFQVDSLALVPMLGAALALAAVAAFAAYLPARRASRVNPVTALRSE